MHRNNRFNHRFMILAVLAGLALLGLSGCYANSTRALGTPIPTVIPATPPQFASLPIPADMSASMAVNMAAGTPASTTVGAPESTPAKRTCAIKAVDLLGAWVAAKVPETDPFPFTDLSGDTCQGTFAADIQPLFTRSNVWYPGIAPCVSCHNEDLKTAFAQLDVSSYAGILAGSRRSSPDAKGNNILGMSDTGTDWTTSILYMQLTTFRMPSGRPPVGDPLGPVVWAGSK